MRGSKKKAKVRKAVALTEVKNDLTKYVQLAEREEIVITRNGRPAAVLIGFRSDEDWEDYCLEGDPRFLDSIRRARASLKAGKGVRLEEIAD